jgi:hypothetical protein
VLVKASAALYLINGDRVKVAPHTRDCHADCASKRGVAVIALPGDVALRDLSDLPF